MLENCRLWKNTLELSTWPSVSICLFVCRIAPPTSYSNIEICVLINGWSTDFFKPEQRVRQGCSLSLYLFILGVEGELGWRSGESTRLPPMWPGLDSRTRPRM